MNLLAYEFWIITQMGELSSSHGAHNICRNYHHITIPGFARQRRGSHNPGIVYDIMMPWFSIHLLWIEGLASLAAISSLPTLELEEMMLADMIDRI